MLYELQDTFHCELIIRAKPLGTCWSETHWSEGHWEDWSRDCTCVISANSQMMFNPVFKVKKYRMPIYASSLGTVIPLTYLRECNLATSSYSEIREYPSCIERKQDIPGKKLTQASQELEIF